jgi:hypothetical protein
MLFLSDKHSKVGLVVCLSRTTKVLCCIQFSEYQLGGAFMVDVEKALVDPALVFKTPEEVLADSELSREQKIKILRRWEYDVRELQVAEEEGMEGRSL